MPWELTSTMGYVVVCVRCYNLGGTVRPAWTLKTEPEQ